MKLRKEVSSSPGTWVFITELIMSGRECICLNIARVKFDTRPEVPSSIEYLRTYVFLSFFFPPPPPLFLFQGVRIPNNDGIIPSWRWYRD